MDTIGFISICLMVIGAILLITYWIYNMCVKQMKDFLMLMLKNKDIDLDTFTKYMDKLEKDD